MYTMAMMDDVLSPLFFILFKFVLSSEECLREAMLKLWPRVLTPMVGPKV